MAHINLLPWREELRKEKKKEFGILVGAFAGVGALIAGIVAFYHVQLIEYQQDRNKFVQTQIVELDKKIKELNELEKERKRLIDRIRAIEGLQSNRPLIVRFFDELIASLPEGVSVTNVQQLNDAITINGEAQSNARVSSFMRNLETSQWLSDPKLDIIQSKDATGTRINSFTLRFKQVIPKAEGEEET